MTLHNRLSKDLLKEQLEKNNEGRVTISFYKYHAIEDPAAFRDSLYRAFEQHWVLGRVYVAHEGINAQISVPETRFDAFVTDLYAIDFLNGVRLNIAVEDSSKSFFKLKVLVREKIVADGLDDFTYDPSDSGEYLSAEAFNRMVDEENPVIVDMRNHYESEVGHFKGAILPDADTFRDELPMVENMLKGKEKEKVIMYCTGGIRCEKATAYFKHKGFKNVFHLEGGIIKYARDVQAKGLENKFVGKNFVFDERLGEKISDDIVAHCHQCGAPCDAHTNCKNDGCHLLFIQCEKCAEKYEGCCSTGCQEFIHLPVEEQRLRRKGIDKGRQVFKKGRFVRREDGSLQRV